MRRLPLGQERKMGQNVHLTTRVSLPLRRHSVATTL